MNAAAVARAIAALRAVESLDTTSMDAGSYAAFRVVRRDAAEARKGLEAGLESVYVPVVAVSGDPASQAEREEGYRVFGEMVKENA